MREDDLDLADDAPEDDVDDDEFLREVARVEDVQPPSLQPLLGERVAHFRILSELGRGGMGIVYLAHDDKLRRAVALKVLPPSLTRNEERRRRFLREARAAAAVSDPHLATIYEVDEVDGRIYIAMERIEGSTLRQVLASRRPGLDEAIELAAQIASGLARAHAGGVVHRDLKPDNVMVTAGGTAKLLDFGLAKLAGDLPEVEGEGGGGEGTARLDESVGDDTAAHHVLGTPGYMSPEQARGGAVDHRADIFSFGVIFYEMLAGVRPFAGKTHADVTTAILRDPPLPIGGLRSDVPPAIAALVHRCLEKDPQARYQDAEAIVGALFDHLDAQEGRPAKARRMAAAVMAPAGAAPSPSSTMQGMAAEVATPSVPGAGAARARARMGWRAGVAGLVAAAGVVVIVAVRRPAPGPAVTAAATSTALPAATRPTPVTDLPMPPSRSQEALAEYAGAMQGFRDGNWGMVEEHLHRAVTLDPGLAAGYLRLAVINTQGRPSLGEAREWYARAVLGRTSLSERDQALLGAYEPLLGREPPSHYEHVKGLRAATERYPGDAELFALLSYAGSGGDPVPALAAAQRSVEIDPLYADGWQAVGKHLFRVGRTEEALAALDRCVRLSPAAADCSGERGWLLSTEGRCQEMEASFRRAVASSKLGIWDDGRAAALFALGRPPETVAEVFRQKWSRLPAGSRPLMQLYDQTRLDMATGRFDLAEQRLLDAGRLLEAVSDAELHGQQSLGLVYLYTETDRPRKAAQVADRYLKRKDVWIGASEHDAVTINMLWALLHGRAIDAATFRERRDEWLRQHEERAKGRPKWPGWPLAVYAAGIETEAEARQALEEFPAELEKPAAELARHKRTRVSGAVIGKLLVLAGREAEAIPYLRRVVDACDALDMPIVHTDSAFHLGLALESTGDQRGACAAHKIVLDRWDNARPTSRTATRARARYRAMRCGE